MANTNLHRTNILKALENTLGNVDELNITHIALGSGTTPFSQSDTQLDNEQFRKDITQISRQSTLVRTITQVLQSQANGFDIYEVGLFANGTATPNSGNLVGRFVYSTPIEKTSLTAKNFVIKEIIEI